MAYKTVFEPAELFLSHKGVDIYHCYKDDEIEQGQREYHFVLCDSLNEDESFDIRELNAWHNPLSHTYTVFREILIAAIDSGELKPYQPIDN